MSDKELEKRIKLKLAIIHKCKESDITIYKIDVLTDCFQVYVIYKVKYSLPISFIFRGDDI